jgi:hypothetical protein
MSIHQSGLNESEVNMTIRIGLPVTIPCSSVTKLIERQKKVKTTVQHIGQVIHLPYMQSYCGLLEDIYLMLHFSQVFLCNSAE